MSILSDELKQTIQEFLEQPINIRGGVTYIFKQYRIWSDNNGLIQLEQFDRYAGWVKAEKDFHWLNLTVKQISGHNSQIPVGYDEEILGYAVFFALLKHKKFAAPAKIKPYNRKAVVQTIDELNGCFDELVTRCTKTIIEAIRLKYTKNRIKLLSMTTLVAANHKFNKCKNSQELENLLNRDSKDELPNEIVTHFIDQLNKTDAYSMFGLQPINSLKISSEMNSFKELILCSINRQLKRDTRLIEGNASTQMINAANDAAQFALSYITTSDLELINENIVFIFDCLLKAMSYKTWGLSLILVQHALNNPECNLEKIKILFDVFHTETQSFQHRHYRVIEGLAEHCLSGKKDSTVNSFLNYVEKYQNEPDSINSLLLLAFPKYNTASSVPKELNNTDSNRHLDEWFSIDSSTGLTKLAQQPTELSLNTCCADFLIQCAVDFTDYNDPVIHVEDMVLKDVSKSPNGLAWAACLNGKLLPEHLLGDKRFAAWLPKIDSSFTAKLWGAEVVKSESIRNGTTAIFLKMNGHDVERILVIDSRVEVGDNQAFKLKAINNHALHEDEDSDKLCAHLNEIGYFDHLWELPIGTDQV